MRPRLKPLREQVIVLTGATSGIGLVTARMAAKRGARLVIAARSEEALRQLADELKAQGTEVSYVVADVGKEADVRSISDAALAQFGGFDTWINGVGIAIYGKVEEVSLEDQRRLFDTNYWSIVYGSRIACEHLRQHGGKLINIGSSLSERAIPIQGVYSASKAAVMNFTDALRMELERDGAPVSVTLIKPGAIDTPYKDHAGNYMGVKPKNPPPVYAPDTVARAILHAAEHHPREMVIGGGGKMITLMGNAMPWLSDKVMELTMDKLQRTSEPEPGIRRGALYQPGEDGHERSHYPVVLEHSLYSQAARHKAKLAAAIGAAALLYGLSRARGGKGRGLR